MEMLRARSRDGGDEFVPKRRTDNESDYSQDRRRRHSFPRMEGSTAVKDNNTNNSNSRYKGESSIEETAGSSSSPFRKRPLTSTAEFTSSNSHGSSREQQGHHTKLLLPNNHTLPMQDQRQLRGNNMGTTLSRSQEQKQQQQEGFYRSHGQEEIIPRSYYNSDGGGGYQRRAVAERPSPRRNWQSDSNSHHNYHSPMGGRVNNCRGSNNVQQQMQRQPQWGNVKRQGPCRPQPQQQRPQYHRPYQHRDNRTTIVQTLTRNNPCIGADRDEQHGNRMTADSQNGRHQGRKRASETMCDSSSSDVSSPPKYKRPRKSFASRWQPPTHSTRRPTPGGQNGGREQQQKQRAMHSATLPWQQGEKMTSSSTAAASFAGRFVPRKSSQRQHAAQETTTKHRRCLVEPCPRLETSRNNNNYNGDNKMATAAAAAAGGGDVDNDDDTAVVTLKEHSGINSEETSGLLPKEMSKSETIEGTRGELTFERLGTTRNPSPTLHAGKSNMGPTSESPKSRVVHEDNTEEMEIVVKIPPSLHVEADNNASSKTELKASASYSSCSASLVHHANVTPSVEIMESPHSLTLPDDDDTVELDKRVVAEEETTAATRRVIVNVPAMDQSPENDTIVDITRNGASKEIELKKSSADWSDARNIIEKDGESAVEFIENGKTESGVRSAKESGKSEDIELTKETKELKSVARKSGATDVEIVVERIEEGVTESGVNDAKDNDKSCDIELKKKAKEEKCDTRNPEPTDVEMVVERTDKETDGAVGATVVGETQTSLQPQNEQQNNDSSDSSDDETDEEELQLWVQKMFGILPPPPPPIAVRKKSQEDAFTYQQSDSSDEESSSDQSEDETIDNMRSTSRRRPKLTLHLKIPPAAKSPMKRKKQRKATYSRKKSRGTRNVKAAKVAREEKTREDELLRASQEVKRKREEARPLTAAEVRKILDEDKGCCGESHWVRRSSRQPSRAVLNAPGLRSLVEKLRVNDYDMVVLKMKKYCSDPDTPSMVIDAALDALEENTNCQALYIQNFNEGMRDEQVLHLLRILQMPSCNIWCLNIGETYNVRTRTWEMFSRGLQDTKITHMYASEHTISTTLKDEIRATIRRNRTKHDMHCNPDNLDVIVQCTHCWWNPINTKSLRPYLSKRGMEYMLHDKEAQGLLGSTSLPGAATTAGE